MNIIIYNATKIYISNLIKIKKNIFFKFYIQLILIGDSFVGKTSLILRFCKATYDENCVSTIGIDTKKKYIKRDDNKIELIIWDTAGEEKYRSLAKNCCNQMDGIVFCI